MVGSTVVVAMSGGVDSSVAALLLKRAGHDVVGLFMRTGSHGEGRTRSCCSVTDSRDAGRVADLLNIPLYRVNFEEEFSRIVDEFVSDYRAGRTPNPCIACNRDLKFGRLLDYADAVGAGRVATGHYASVARAGSRWAVRRGRDSGKDQSYVLFPLRQSQLERTVLPLGDLEKIEVRDLARGAGLPVAEKPDSQEICFVPEGGYGVLLGQRGGLTPGPILNGEGVELGRHEGYELFTIGQRRGLGTAFGRPMYVLAIDPGRAAVTIGEREELGCSGMTVQGWVGGARPAPEKDESYRARVKIRYRHAAAPAEITGLGGGRCVVRFEAPQSAVTPGQAAVAYAHDVVAGGGWIEASGTE